MLALPPRAWGGAGRTTPGAGPPAHGVRAPRSPALPAASSPAPWLQNCEDRSLCFPVTPSVVFGTVTDTVPEKVLLT